jgi:hypothetical protein
MANRSSGTQGRRPTADPDAKNAFYNKIGLYRDRLKVPMRIYYDDYAMGGSYEAVDPERVNQR